MTGERRAEAALDAALAEARAAPPSPAPAALLERIMADAALVAAERAAPMRRRNMVAEGMFAGMIAGVRRLFAGAPLKPAAACMAAAAFGLWLGQSAPVADAAEALLSAPSAVAYEDDPMAGVALAFGYDEEGW